MCQELIVSGASMISHQHQCIFVHLRKNAGNSIKQIFGDQTEIKFNNGVLDPDWRKSDPAIQSYFKFCLVRNPWDRFISGWKFCRTTKDRDIVDVLRNLPDKKYLNNIFASDVSFHSRVVYTADLLRLGYMNATYQVGLRKKTRLQIHNYYHLTQQQYKPISYPDGKLAVDEIFFFENLHDVVHFLDDKFNLKYGNIPKVNINRHKDDYRKYFNDEALELFAEKYETDIRVWGYKFEDGPGIPPAHPPKLDLIEQETSRN